MAKVESIKLNNKAFTVRAANQIISSLSKQADKFNANVTTAVSIAVAHAGLHSNLNPLISLFDGFRLKSGKLNKQGRLLKAYTLTYYKALAFDDADKPTFKQVMTPVEGEEKGKKELRPISVNSRGFYLTNEKGENGKQARYRFNDDKRSYTGLPSFGEWLEAETAKEAKEKPKASVSGLKRRLTALADMLDDFDETVEPDTFKEIQDAASAIYKRIHALNVATVVDVMQSALHPLGPDADLTTDNLLNTPNGGKKGHKVHASAGRKVA